MTTLTDFNPWLHYVANRLLPPSHPDHDDVVQEGWIAMWKAYPTYDGRTDKGSLEGWLRMCARRRMLDIAYQRKPPFGHLPDRNHRHVRNPLSLDEYLENNEDRFPPNLITDDTLHDVEVAYHQGEFLEALERLTETQRRYVVLRFWGGLFELHNQGSPEQREVTRELAPEFADVRFRRRERLTPKEELAQFLDHMRTGYGD